MGKIIAGVKTIDGNTSVQMKTEKPTNKDYALALVNLELIRKKLFEAFEKHMMKRNKNE